MKNLKLNGVDGSLIEYLREILSLKNYHGEDKARILISKPCSIDFELMVMKYALEILDSIKLSKMHFRKNVDQNYDYANSVIYQHNL